MTEQFVRDALVTLTDPVPGEALRGILFAVGLIATDHVLNVLGMVWDLP